MSTKPLAFATVVGGALLLTGCWDTPDSRQIVDVTPVGDGLVFLGIAAVLVALIVVLGRFIEDAVINKWTFVPHLMVSLLCVLALVVIAAALPTLIIPISLGVVVAVVLAFAWHR